jgi:tRNA threonylcarbamoyladenosine biosynthesis protein TsaE
MPETAKKTRGSSVRMQDLPQLATQLIEAGKGLTVWLLFGDMGAGKTTLVKQVVKQMGLDVNVASPTFSIVNEYGQAGRPAVYHLDLYRLKNETEALDIGMEEYLTSGILCLVEWPEKIRSLWPERYLEITLEHQDAMTRKVQYRRHD